MTSYRKKHDFDEIFDSQKIYRKLLEAVSNPLRTLNIKDCSVKIDNEEPEMLALALSLLDNEVSFAVCSDDSLSDDIAFMTLAKKMPVNDADYIFVTDESMLKSAVADAKPGTLSDPHKSATMLIKNTGKAYLDMKFYGPGIKDKIELKVTDIMKMAIEFRNDKACEYPQGIDIVFISEAGDICAIPRLVIKEDI